MTLTHYAKLDDVRIGRIDGEQGPREEHRQTAQENPSGENQRCAYLRDGVDSIEFLRTHVLPGECDGCVVIGVHRSSDKSFDIGGRGTGRHHRGAKGVRIKTSWMTLFLSHPNIFFFQDDSSSEHIYSSSSAPPNQCSPQPNQRISGIAVFHDFGANFSVDRSFAKLPNQAKDRTREEYQYGRDQKE